jgi:hypothetical protein
VRIVNRSADRFFKESFKRGRKATEDGAKAGEAGRHFDAANFYGVAARAFMAARNDALAYEADGFQNYHFAIDGAQTGAQERAARHFDDAEIYFQRADDAQISNGADGSRHSHSRSTPFFWSHVCGGKAAFVRGLMALRVKHYSDAARWFDQTRAAFDKVQSFDATGTPTSIAVEVNRRHARALASYARAEQALSEGHCEKATTYFRESESTWTAVINVPGAPASVAQDIQGWVYFARASANYTSALSAREAGNNQAALDLLIESRVHLRRAERLSAESTSSDELVDRVRKRMVWVDYALSCTPTAPACGATNEKQHCTANQSSSASDRTITEALSRLRLSTNTQPPRLDIAEALSRLSLGANSQPPRSDDSATRRPRDGTPAPSPRTSPTIDMRCHGSAR